MTTKNETPGTIDAISRRDILIKGATAAVTVAATIGALQVPGAFAAAPLIGAKKTITVGAKDFSESQLVAYMYYLLLEQAGLPVNSALKENLPSNIATPALQRGDIDIFPEYTGTGLEVILKQTAPHTASAYYSAVSAGYKKHLGLTWLDQAPMDDAQGFATTRAFSTRHGIKSIADMVKKASDVRLIVTTEYPGRPDGLPGVKKVYGNFTPKKLVLIAGAGSVRYAALTHGVGDVVEAFTTDGLIAGDNLVVLTDPKGYASPDNLAPVVRSDTLKLYPKIADALNKLAPKLTSAAITKLNYFVDGQHMDLNTVAKTFLQQQGLLK